jgi:hypothetical protein
MFLTLSHGNAIILEIRDFLVDFEPVLASLSMLLIVLLVSIATREK